VTNILREYIREILKESVEVSGFAAFVGESFFNPDAKEAVLVDTKKFDEEFKKAKKSNKLFTDLDAVKIAARSSVVGYISVGPPLRGSAWGAWEVTRSAGRGYGKIVYGMGYALSPRGLLIPDRTSVSDDARSAWEKASKTRDSLQLDAMPPENRTDTREDDTDIHDEEDYEYLDRAYKAQGWEKGMMSSLMDSGTDLESKISKILKGKRVEIAVAAFLSAGGSLFGRQFNS
jgi:hypothetical protein